MIGVKAEKHVISPHSRVSSEARQEGYEGSNEEANNLNLDTIEYSSGSCAMHIDSKTQAARKEKQSGVRKY
jgi:phosphosulfolactate synthase (CoM biosynthesis protein A)